MLLLNVNSEACAEAGTTDALLALCVNLACSERAARQMAGEGRLRELLARAFRHRSAVLMKLARNLSLHAPVRPLFVVGAAHVQLADCWPLIAFTCVIPKHTEQIDQCA